MTYTLSNDPEKRAVVVANLRRWLDYRRRQREERKALWYEKERSATKAISALRATLRAIARDERIGANYVAEQPEFCFGEGEWHNRPEGYFYTV